MAAIKYHSLIFDLDGTLTDPLLGIVRCMNYALTTFDHPPRAEHEITPYIRLYPAATEGLPYKGFVPGYGSQPERILSILENSP